MTWNNIIELVIIAYQMVVIERWQCPYHRWLSLKTINGKTQRLYPKNTYHPFSANDTFKITYFPYWYRLGKQKSWNHLLHTVAALPAAAAVNSQTRLLLLLLLPAGLSVIPRAICHPRRQFVCHDMTATVTPWNTRNEPVCSFAPPPRGFCDSFWFYGHFLSLGTAGVSRFHVRYECTTAFIIVVLTRRSVLLINGRIVLTLCL